MKQTKHLLLAFLLLATVSARAQVGIGVATPAASAQLDVSSTTKGFLPPRMTEAQRNAIPTPAAGLIIWCTDCGTSGELQVYNGVAWTNMIGGTVSVNPNPSITICSQSWMLKNLDVDKYRNGDPIPKITNPTAWAALTTGAYCYYNNDSATYAATYGKLYNWYAVNDPRGLAPSGWHVPSDAEWTTLSTCLGGDAVAGGKMKETGTTHWASPNIGATNISDFTGLPGGFRYADGIFNDVGYNGYWWSSTEVNTANAWSRYLYFADGNIYRYNGLKERGSSVRCLRDLLPDLTTTTATGITINSAVSGGNITSDNGSPVTARGICFNTIGTPAITNSTVVNGGTGIGVFSCNLTGLTASTTYYVRAFATNSVGTAYGNEIIFTTLAPISSVTICAQTWMIKNLDVATYRNGDSIPQITDPTAWAALTTGAWCYYNNDPSNNATYGKLYNWYAVNDPRGLAPSGWHVPSDAEWTTLSTCLGGDAVAGGKMKTTGTTTWTSPNTDATNTSGWTGLPGGYRYFNGSFSSVGDLGYWWSSSQFNTTWAWYRYLYYANGSVFSSYNLKQLGFSVRCLRD